MPRPFLERVRSGQQLLATIVSLPCPEVAEMAAQSGFDWLFIDAEHGPLSRRMIQTMLQAAGDCPGIVRIPAVDPVWVGQVLDAGAAGVLVPQVRDAGQVAAMVRAAKYPPDGERGVGVARAQGYGAALESYLQTADRDTLVLVQAEHQQAVDNIDEICAVSGLDGVLIGPFDLSASLGVTGQVDHPRVSEAIARVLAACKAAGIAAAIFAATPEQARVHAAQGFSMIAIATDTLALGNVMRANLESFWST